MSPTPTVSATYTTLLPADTAWLSGVRRLTSARLRHWGLGSGTVEDAVLIADELFANAVQHGSASARDEVSLSLALGHGELRIAIADTSSLTPRCRQPSEDEECGRGLLLIEAVADKWGTEPVGCGKATWAVLVLWPCPPPQQQEPQTAAWPR
ncbi:ATP-binding protein [Streptomyces sp. N2-109]|uniref:ATP-binding protein n=1 Tax=Streptomyces gossypii TaxID=2883101 RepID=A0ABT2JQ00_9ACTN|nr:ATP-binding protein [Streptomyces gossypii]MCT2589811.1 ATP-binding protein [Streptomyces gossypii]